MTDNIAVLKTDPTRETGMALLEKVVVGGDLAALSSGDRLRHYAQICQSVGLNPLTRPFSYLFLNGKLVLYANKECTEQLRVLRHVSVTRLESVTENGLYTVTAYGKEGKHGREDVARGMVSVEGLKGLELANAQMKAESKAKRRLTLSICGLGMLDESEVGPGFRVHDETSPTGLSTAVPAEVDHATGEIKEGAPQPDLPTLSVEDQRSILLGQVKGAADKLQLKGAKRAELWAAHCGEATEANVDPAALHDLLRAIKVLGKAAQG